MTTKKKLTRKIKVIIAGVDPVEKNTAAYNRFLAIEKMIKSEFVYDRIIPKRISIQKKSRILNGIINRIYLLKLLIFKIIEINRREYNVILFLKYVDTFLFFIIWIITKPMGVKIAIERNEFPVFMLNKNFVVKKYFYKYFILPWCYRMCDVLFLMTDELIEFYSKYTKKDCIIEKLPMTVDISRFKDVNSLSGVSSPYIFYAGSLSEAKDGVESLIMAFKKVEKYCPHINLKIAGSSKRGRLEYRLNKIIEENQLENRISLLGSLGREEVLEYFMHAKIVVLPRPDSMQARGGFPTKLGEYLAAEKPVILTKVGEIPLYLSDRDVFFISPDNIVSELADRIEYVLTHYDEALKVAHSGRLAAEKYFSLNVNQGIIKRAFEHLIEKRSQEYKN